MFEWRQRVLDVKLYRNAANSKSLFFNKGEPMSVPPPSVLEQQFDRAFSLRDTALRLLQRDGAWADVEGYPGRVRSFHSDSLFILHRTPFQPVPVSNAAVMAGVAPQAQRDIAREYGLDIWRDNKKVLSLIWNDGGSLGIVLFKQGVWEDELTIIADSKT